MFNFFSNQTESQDPSNQTESQDPVFTLPKLTEKELILYVIKETAFASNFSKIYNELALPEWKAQYSIKKGRIRPYNVWEDDESLILELAQTSDDEDIIRAIYDTHRTGFVLVYTGEIIYPELYLNINLPDDLIDCYINSPIFLLGEDLSKESVRLQNMLKVGFNSTVNEKIQRRIDEIVIIKRKKKENKTKNKLKAFLITASATKSVLTGNSVDDVVEETINEEVDEQVLDYMNKLLGKVK